MEELKQGQNAKVMRMPQGMPGYTKDIGTHSKIEYLTLGLCAVYWSLKDIGTHSKIEFHTSWASSTPAWSANSGH